MKKVLLIGDSISLDYGPRLRELVREDIHVSSKQGRDEAYQNLDLPIGGNGGDSARVLRYACELAQTGGLDGVSHFFFNCGLHDIKRERPNEELQISPDEYRSNLKKILDLMKKHGIIPVFITTTQADGSRYKPTAPFTRRAEDVLAYNRIAEDLMRENGVQIIDLYAFTKNLGRVGDSLYRDHTHFTPEVIELQAAYLADAMNRILPRD